MRRAFLLVVLSLMSSVNAWAQTTSVPPLINFQGRLAKPDGTPIPDGNYVIKFSLWDAATGGNNHWNQSMNPVLVRNGVFAVLLGNGNPITENILNGNVWLEIKVGDDVPLSPRQQIVSVPFAIKANTVPDGAITPPKINTNGAAAGQSLTFNGSSVLWDNPLARGLLLPFATSLSSTTVGEEVNT